MSIVIALTILFHGVLLLVFRPLEQPIGAMNSRQLHIQRMDLTDPDNRPVVDFINTHDPALMTMPHRRYGYSSFLNDFPAHPAPEDLPSPPRLIPPAVAPEIAPLPTVAAARVLLLPSGGEYPVERTVPRKIRQLTQPAEVWLNNRRWDAMEQLLLELKADRLEWQSDPKPLQTVLFIAPARLDGELENIQIQQRSGNRQLDQLAIMALNKYIMKYDRRPSGEVVWIWRNDLKIRKKVRK